MGHFFKYIIFFVFALFMCFFIYENQQQDYRDISRVDLSRATNLMIVAHPDDETLWGGAHLLDEDYLVVCVTCGNDKNRVMEFQQALAISDDQYLMLDYPDKVNGKRDDWATSLEFITEDLKEIMQIKNWDKIVTHNIDGEYGHIHHKMLHDVVTSVYDNNSVKGSLYFFGKYYKKNDMSLYQDNLTPINSDVSSIKINQMIEVYKSQSFIKDSFGHMFNYENWIEYILEG